MILDIKIMKSRGQIMADMAKAISASKENVPANEQYLPNDAVVLASGVEDCVPIEIYYNLIVGNDDVVDFGVEDDSIIYELQIERVSTLVESSNLPSGKF